MKNAKKENSLVQDNSNSIAAQLSPDAGMARDLELMNWQGEDICVTSEELHQQGKDISLAKDGSILLTRLQSGTGHQHPKLCGNVTVQLRGRILPVGCDFDSRQLQFEFGAGSEKFVCVGLEAVINQMHEGDWVRCYLSSSAAFGASGCPQLNVPPTTALIYDVYLHRIQNPKEPCQLDVDEKLSVAAEYKQRGNHHLTCGRLHLAQEYYKRAACCLEDVEFLRCSSSVQQQGHNLLLAVHLNCALAALKLSQFSACICHCNHVLKQLPSCEKALYRRGMARMKMCDYQMALQDFIACHRVNGANAAAAVAANQCRQSCSLKTKQRNQIFYGMFDKFAAEDVKQGKVASYLTDFPIDHWDNKLADGMLSIPQELEAFGEEMPQKKRIGGHSDPIKEETEHND